MYSNIISLKLNGVRLNFYFNAIIRIYLKQIQFIIVSKSLHLYGKQWLGQSA